MTSTRSSPQAMSSGNPLFVYNVPESPWHVVVTDKASHFYFNSVTRASVWQITETDGDLPNKLDYNELAVLFAKARGFSVKREEKRARGSDAGHSTAVQKPEVSNIEPESEEERLESESEPETVEVPYDLIDSIVGSSGDVEEKEEIENLEVEAAEQTGVGLLQGYSSDEDEDSEASAPEDITRENEGMVGPEVDDEAARSSPEPDNDINAGLDLGFSGDEEEPDMADTKAEFKEFLSRHSDKFSKYDPWFLVAEELVSVLAQEPALYSLSEGDRESLFNEWVTENSESLQNSSEFPTPTLLLFQELQDNKTEVRTLPFQKFVEELPIRTTVEDADKLYRKLRATLVDFGSYEKQLKKGGYKGENLKVKKVREFVAQELQSLAIEPREHEPSAESFFDKWVELCNAFGLPRFMVEDPTNFILGDEKRYACYKEALTNGK